MVILFSTQFCSQGGYLWAHHVKSPEVMRAVIDGQSKGNIASYPEHVFRHPSETCGGSYTLISTPPIKEQESPLVARSLARSLPACSPMDAEGRRKTSSDGSIRIWILRDVGRQHNTKRVLTRTSRLSPAELRCISAIASARFLPPGPQFSPHSYTYTCTSSHVHLQ